MPLYNKTTFNGCIPVQDGGSACKGGREGGKEERREGGREEGGREGGKEGGRVGGREGAWMGMPKEFRTGGKGGTERGKEKILWELTLFIQVQRVNTPHD